MENFAIFLNQGFFHLLDLNGADHMLFLASILAVFTYKDYKQILAVTAFFTLGHSITLAISALGIWSLPSAWVEFLIALSIVFTAVENILFPQSIRFRMLTVGFFGLIHGLGFSTLLKELFAGMDFSIWDTLLPFNMGLELAQLVFAAAVIALQAVLLRVGMKLKLWTYGISIVVIAFSGYWCVERAVEVFSN